MAATYFMAFKTSKTLADNIQRFFTFVDGSPSKVDNTLLDSITDDFLDEMLAAFFLGPVQVVDNPGRLASIMQGINSVVSKIAKGLAKRLLKKIDTGEQANLAAHFRSISLNKDGDFYIGFPLDDDYAKRAMEAFAWEKDQVDEAKLTKVMHGITDGAVSHFMDGAVAQLKVGRIVKGLVATARVSVQKASYSSAGHLMSLPAKEHRQVMDYFTNMLVEK